MIIETSRKVNFGVYKWTKNTGLGQRTYGEYKDNRIDIYYDKQDKTKLIYVSDMFMNWIKSKLIYFENGIKKVLRSQKGG